MEILPKCIVKIKIKFLENGIKGENMYLRYIAIRTLYHTKNGIIFAASRARETPSWGEFPMNPGKLRKDVGKGRLG